MSDLLGTTRQQKQPTRTSLRCRSLTLSFDATVADAPNASENFRFGSNILQRCEKSEPLKIKTRPERCVSIFALVPRPRLARLGHEACASRPAPAITDSIVKQPSVIVPGVCFGAQSPSRFFASRKVRERSADRRLTSPRFGGAAHARARGALASRRSTAAFFDPGPRFPGHWRPDQPAPGGRTLVSARRCPGPPECVAANHARRGRTPLRHLDASRWRPR